MRSANAVALLRGIAVGDALGWPWERPDRVIDEPQPDGHFYRWRRRAGSRFWAYEESLPPGTYSDDTQLMLCVARSLLSASWFEHFVSRELPTWRLYERGGGGAVLRAARSWTDGRAPWIGPDKRVAQYFDAGANGVAMRIAPHVIVGGKDVLARVVADGITTHGHPRALIGGTLHAWALDWALGLGAIDAPGDVIRQAAAAESTWGDAGILDHLPITWKEAAGDEYIGAWSAARDETVRLLELAAERADEGPLVPEASVLQELGATDRKTNGAGHVCAVAALFLAARYASQPAQALQSAARQPGADTDTLGAMTGSLLGAIGGLEALGSFPGVQDEDYIDAVAERLIGLTKSPDVEDLLDRLEEKPATLTDEFPPQDVMDGSDVDLPDGRAARVIQRRVLSDQGAPNEVTGTWLRTEDGQGLVAISRRRSPSHQRPARDDQAGNARDAPAPTGTSSGAQHPAGDVQAQVESAGHPSVQVVVLVAEPREVIDALQALGLTGHTTDVGWTLHGLPIVIQGADGVEGADVDRSPRNQEDVTVTVQRLTLRASTTGEPGGEAANGPVSQLTLEID